MTTNHEIVTVFDAPHDHEIQLDDGRVFHVLVSDRIVLVDLVLPDGTTLPMPHGGDA
jgi:hypothetical protein